MSLEVEVGSVLHCKTGKVGESTHGPWCLIKAVDKKGKNLTPCWVSNTDHGVYDGDTDFNFRVDSLSKVKVGQKEYPKGSGKWYPEASCNITGKKVGDACDTSIPDFTAPTFTPITEPDDGELPF